MQYACTLYTTLKWTSLFQYKKVSPLSPFHVQLEWAKIIVISLQLIYYLHVRGIFLPGLGRQIPGKQKAVAKDVLSKTS